MIRIAIVDDEKNVLKYISDKIMEILEKFKYEAKIELYTNGNDVIEADRTQSFDILFLDLEMQEPDGMQTAEIIRDNNANAIIAIVTNCSDLVYKKR